jgi:hypothetical protein
MTANDFVIWLKGFAQAANNFTLTPKQWDDIREQLDKVNDKPNTGGYTISIKDGMVGTTTTSETRGDITYKQDELTTNTVF